MQWRLNISSVRLTIHGRSVHGGTGIPSNEWSMGRYGHICFLIHRVLSVSAMYPQVELRACMIWCQAFNLQSLFMTGWISLERVVCVGRWHVTTRLIGYSVTIICFPYRRNDHKKLWVFMSLHNLLSPMLGIIYDTNVLCVTMPSHL